MRYDRVIIVLFAALLLFGLMYRSRPGGPEPAQTASAVLSPPRGYVSIQGAVKHPGMYELTANNMTGAVIELSVPVAPVYSSDISVLTARPLASGDEVELVLQPDGRLAIRRGMVPVAQRLTMGIPLDINRMDESDFDRVPGIGPELAQRIVRFRHNNGGIMKPQDLLAVEGIGEKKLAALVNYFK